MTNENVQAESINKSKWNKYPVNNDVVLEWMNVWENGSEEIKRKTEELLIKKLSYLTNKIARKHINKHYYEDILMEVKLGLICALREFDSQRGPNFFKYAQWKMKNKVRDFMSWYIRSSKRFEYKNSSLYENIKTPCEKLEKQEQLRALFKALDFLSDREKSILNLRFGLDGGDPKVLREIGEVFNLSKERIRQIEVEAIKKLKKVIEIKDLED